MQTTTPPLLPDWVYWVQALGPTLAAIAIGIFAALIAWGQWRTARDKLKWELFERRLNVYLATVKLVEASNHYTNQTGRIIEVDFGEFSEAIRGAEFLFDGKIAIAFRSIGELFTRSAALRLSLRVAVPTEFDTLLDDQKALMVQVHEFGKTIEADFRPYLDVSTVL